MISTHQKIFIGCKNIHLFWLLIAISYSCGKKSDITTPSKKDITHCVYASGKLLPVNDYKVFSKFPGYVSAIHVKIGDSVAAGAPLISIRNDQTEFNAESAKNAMLLAQKNSASNSPLLQALKNEMSSAKSRYELDSLNFMRYSSLLKQNAVSQAQFEQSKMQFDISKQNLLKTQNTYLTTKDRLNTEAVNAELQYKTLLANKNEFLISADKKGMIYDIDTRVGEMISIQKPIMEIGDAVKFELELFIDETDIRFVKPGQEIAFTIDAFNGEIFKAKVREIYPRISQANKTSKVVADITFAPASNIYSYLSVEANIIINSKKNALVIPREFLTEGNKVKIKGAQNLTLVKTGIQDIDQVEITDGIKENTELEKP